MKRRMNIIGLAIGAAAFVIIGLESMAMYTFTIQTRYIWFGLICLFGCMISVRNIVRKFRQRNFSVLQGKPRRKSRRANLFPKGGKTYETDLTSGYIQSAWDEVK